MGSKLTNSSECQTNFNCLPDDCVSLVLYNCCNNPISSKADGQTLSRITRVCRRWRELIHNASLSFDFSKVRCISSNGENKTWEQKEEAAQINLTDNNLRTLLTTY